MSDGSKFSNRVEGKKNGRLTRAKLFNISTELFGNYGYASTSIQMIAKRCFLSKASIFHYIDDKEQLAQLVLERFIKEVETTFSDIIHADELSNIQKLQRIKMMLCQLFSEHSKHYLPMSFLVDNIFFDIIQRHLLTLKNNITTLLALFNKACDGIMKERLTIQLVGLLSMARFLSTQQIEEQLNDFIQQISGA